MTQRLPPGFTLDEPEREDDVVLPPGFTLDAEPASGMGRARSALGSFAQGAADVGASVVEAPAIAAGAMGGPDPRETGPGKTAEAIRAWTKEHFPTNPAYAGEFLTDVLPQGAGSTVGFAGAGLAAGAALAPIGLGAAGATVAGGLTAAGLGAASGASQGFHDALGHGADIETAYKSSGLNAIIGTSEGLPIARLLQKLDNGSGGTITKLLKQGLKQGAEEGIQEVGQQIAQNAVAQNLYDPETGLFDGAAQGGAAGLTLGGVLGFVAATLGHGRMRAREERERTAEQAAQQEQEQAEAARRADMIGPTGPVQGPSQYPVIDTNPVQPMDQVPRLAAGKDRASLLARAERIKAAVTTRNDLTNEQRRTLVRRYNALMGEVAEFDRTSGGAHGPVESRGAVEKGSVAPQSPPPAPRTTPQPAETPAQTIIPTPTTGPLGVALNAIKEPAAKPPVVDEHVERIRAARQQLAGMPEGPERQALVAGMQDAARQRLAAPPQPVVGETVNKSGRLFQVQQMPAEGQRGPVRALDITDPAAPRAATWPSVAAFMRNVERPNADRLAEELGTPIIQRHRRNDASTQATASPSVPNTSPENGAAAGDGSRELGGSRVTGATQAPAPAETAPPAGFVIDTPATAAIEAAGRAVNQEPTPAQAEAGNYQKGHVRVQGMDISIETPKGGVRRSKDPSRPWEVTLPAHYGYIRGTKGADGDHIDTYIGNNPESQKAFVVDQIDPQTGEFDEHKVILGADSQDEAEAIYDGGFSDGFGPDRMGAITEITVDDLKAWATGGERRGSVQLDLFGGFDVRVRNENAKERARELIDELSAEEDGPSAVLRALDARDDATARLARRLLRADLAAEDNRQDRQIERYRLGAKEGSPAPAEHPGPVIKSLETGKETALQPAETVAPERTRLQQIQDEMPEGYSVRDIRPSGALIGYFLTDPDGNETRHAASPAAVMAMIRKAAADSLKRNAERGSVREQPVKAPEIPPENIISGARAPETQTAPETRPETRPENTISGVSGVSGVLGDLGDLGASRFTTAETTHAKTGKPLFVASIKRKVDSAEYEKLAVAAKRHGGYYSSFNRNGAIPGFQFPSKISRASFLADVDAKPELTITTPPAQVEQMASTASRAQMEYDLRNGLPNGWGFSGTHANGKLTGWTIVNRDGSQEHTFPPTAEGVRDALAKAREIAARGEQQPDQNGRTIIGENGRGQQLWQDGRGVRSYVDDGVRQTESVRMAPGRGISVDTAARGERFSTKEELAAAAAEEQPNGRDPNGSQLGADDRPSNAGESASIPAAARRDEQPAAGDQGKDRSRDGNDGRDPERIEREAGERSAGTKPARTDEAGRADDANGVGAGVRSGDGLSGAGDYRADVGSLTREGSWLQTANRNLDIIELVNELDAEQRPATREEQQLLAKWTGWGASEMRQEIFQAVIRGDDGTYQFNPHRMRYVSHAWKSTIERAANLLAGEDLALAMQSSQYAHFTSEAVTRGMWAAIERMGFKGGLILEPGMGNGLFPITAPDGVMRDSRYTGIELEPFTAKIAKYLLPQQNIIQNDYSKQRLPDGYFDMAIGNPPFANVIISDDPAYRRNSLMLHDYFFVKTLDKVRPGGIVAFVTSKGTMDKRNQKARKLIADRADLLGAIRMPQTAFKANAGTEVVTDILFLRRRAPGEAAGGEQWLGQAQVEALGRYSYEAPTKALVNEYFAAHPEMVVGKHSMSGQMYARDEGAGYTVLPPPDFDAALKAAFGRLPADVYANKKAVEAKINPAGAIERDYDVKTKKEGSLYLSDKGALMVVESGAGVPYASGPMRPSDREWLVDYIGLRDAIKAAHKDQLADGPWEKSLAALNKVYDAFVAKHGNIQAYTTQERSEVNDDGDTVKITYRRLKNGARLRADVESPLLYALESETPDGSFVKGAFLRGRTLSRPQAPRIVTTQDALMVSLDQVGRLDVGHIANLAEKGIDETIHDLGNAIYRDPNGGWVLADEYLWGDVREKLAAAKIAATADPSFDRNVEALIKAQPRPLSPQQIRLKPGMPWMPPKVIKDFAREVMEIDVEAAYNPLTARWFVPPHGKRGRVKTEWSRDYLGADELLDKVLNNKSIRITRTNPERGKAPLFDPERTKAANELAANLVRRFRTWAWEDARRGAELAGTYNDLYNNIAPRSFNGDHLSLPGLNIQKKPYSHQKRAIWRTIQTGNTYYNHAVGAGKTMEMIISGMEMRRLGLIRKPMYVVPGHTLNQFANEFLECYPSAQIMVADPLNFDGDNRRRFLAKAALNDLDAIVIPHSSFKLIGTGPEARQPVIDRMLDELDAAITEATDSGAARHLVKQMENQREAIRRKFEGNSDQSKKDKVLNFEELGVDFLFVDEAHEFRKLDIASDMNIKGVSKSGSQMSMDLFIKTRWLETQRPGRSMVLASGTPVTNTMGELYNVMRYMDHAAMDRDGISQFNAWASMFGEAVTDLELNAAGVYENVERFARFDNLPELMKRVRMFMDVLTSNQLATLVDRPEVATGGPQNIVTAASPSLTTFMKTDLLPRIKASRDWKPSPDQPGNPDPLINIITDARIASIDMRFIDPSLPSDPGSKLNQMIDRVVEEHKKHAGNTYAGAKGTVDKVKGATQIIFSAVGFGEQIGINRGFSAKDWINKRLKAAGIPSEQVAWMSDFDTPAKKQAMFKAMREGTIRMLFGSNKNMGTGMNVQNRLRVLHYLSPPWFPSDVEQPHGRILRQGNQNKEIDLLWYSTKATYDSTAWGMVARKGRFIEQAMQGDDSIRSIDDISQASQYMLASAMAAGDARAMDLAQLMGEVEGLEMLQSDHHREQMSRQYELNEMTREVRDGTAKISRLSKAAEAAGYNPGYTVTIDGLEIAKQIDAGRALMQKAVDLFEENKAAKGLKKGIDPEFLASEHDLGIIDGKHKIVAVYLDDIMGEANKAKIPGVMIEIKVGPSTFETDRKVSIRAAKSYLAVPKEAYEGEGNDVVKGVEGFEGTIANGRETFSIVRKMASILRDLPEMVKSATARKRAAEERAARLTKLVGVPFARYSELVEKTAKVAALKAELAAEGNATAAVADDITPLPDRDSIERATEEAVDGGFDIEEDGELSASRATVLRAEGDASQPMRSYRATPELMAQRRGVVEAATTLARKINPQLAIEFSERLFAQGEVTKRSGGTGEFEEVGGIYDRRRNLVRVSLNIDDNAVVAKAAHEAWHSIERLLPAKDLAILRRAFPSVGMRTQAEEIAYAFEDYISGRPRGATTAHPIFYRVKQFMTALGNMLRGRGFQTAESIFRAVENGRFVEAAADAEGEVHGLAASLLRTKEAAPAIPMDGPVKPDWIADVEPTDLWASSVDFAKNARARVTDWWKTRGLYELVDRFHPWLEAGRRSNRTDPGEVHRLLEMAANDGGAMAQLMAAGAPIYDDASKTMQLKEGTRGLRAVMTSRLVGKVGSEERRRDAFAQVAYIAATRSKGLKEADARRKQMASDMVAEAKRLTAMLKTPTNAAEVAEEAQLKRFIQDLKDGAKKVASTSDREKLLTDEDIATALNVTPSQKERYDATMAEYQAWNDALLQFGVDTGVIAPDAKEAYQAAGTYIPFYRHWEETGELLGPSEFRSGISNPDPKIRQLVGGTSKLNDLYENIERNASAIMSAGRRNIALREVATLAQEIGEGEVVPAGAPAGNKASVLYYEGGTKKRLKVEDELMVASLVALGPQQTTGITKVLQTFAQIYRGGVTLTPSFAIANLFRGSAAGWIQTGDNWGRAANTFTGLRDAYMKSADLSKIQAITGFGGTTYGVGGRLFHESLAEQAGTVTASSLKRWMRGIHDRLSDLSEATEWADRIAIYKNMKARGASDQQAGYAAMNVINYSRRGANSSVQFLTQVVPFLNARIQGLARMLETQDLKNDSPERRKALLKIAARGMVLSALSLALYGAIMADDDQRKRYEEEEQSTRMNYWIIYAGSSKIMVPKPFEFGALFATLPEALIDAIRTQQAGPLASIITGTITNTFGFNPIPQALLPALEVATNYDFFRQHALVPPYLERFLPQERSMPGTSVVAQSIADGLAKLGVQASPINVEHLVQGYGGALALATLFTMDGAAGAIGALPGQPAGVFGDIPGQSILTSVLGRFVRQNDVAPAAVSMKKLYEMKTRGEQALATAKEMQLRGDIEAARAIFEKEAKPIAMRKALNRAAEDMAALSKRARAIRYDEDMTPAKKREAMNLLDARRNEIARRVAGILK